jgi:hypothetical protein
MRWSEERGKIILNFFSFERVLLLLGSKGCFALYSCLTRDAGMTEMDWFSLFQHSTSASDLRGDSAAAILFRFPNQFLEAASLNRFALMGLICLLVGQDGQQGFTYGTPSY